MKIVAKGMISPAYWAHGRQWPRHSQIEIEVSKDQYEAIAADVNIVSVVIPEARPTLEVMPTEHKQSRAK